MARAQALMAVDRDAEAIKVLRAAAGSDPQNADLRCLLAGALLKVDSPSEALVVAQSAAAIAPDYEWPHRVMAYVLIRLRRNKEALAAASQALRLAPDNKFVVQIAASAQLACGKTAEAAATAARLVELDPAWAEGFDVRGRVALKQKRPKEAEAHFREALRMDPSQWTYNNNLGVALQLQRRKKEAIEAFEHAAKADPKAKLPQRNLFSMTRAYIGAAGVVGFVLLLRFVSIVATSHRSIGWNAVPVAVGVTLAVGALWLFALWRRSQLSPSVKRFYRLQLGRERSTEVLRILYFYSPYVLIIVGLAVISAAQSQAFLLWLILASALMIGWRWISPRVWLDEILPRLRPDL